MSMLRKSRATMPGDNERETERRRRVPILEELRHNVEHLAGRMDDKHLSCTKTIRYAQPRKWLNGLTFLPNWLYWKVQSEEAVVIYTRNHGKKDTQIIAVTKSGLVVSSVPLDRYQNWHSGVCDERVVNLSSLRPGDIHPDDWSKLQAAARRACNILATS